MKKAKQRYRLILEDLSRLREIKSFSFSKRLLVVVFSAAFFIILLILWWIFFSSNLGILTGDSDEETFSKIEKLSMSVDSLRNLAEENEKFLNNINNVMDTERIPMDSINAGVLLKQLPVDSLIAASPAERRFVAAMDEQQRYNLQVLSPLDAEGIIFSLPVDGGIAVNDTQKSFMLRMISPVGKGVCSVADGIVIDCYPSANNSYYTIIIQHSNGFVSRYTNVGLPLIEEGGTVYSGQIISEPLSQRGTGRQNHVIGVELWHDGTPLYPANYIYRLNR